MPSRAKGRHRARHHTHAVKAASIPQPSLPALQPSAQSADSEPHTEATAAPAPAETQASSAE